MGTISIKTSIPGPKSQALMEKRRSAVARGPFHSTAIFAAHAEGAVIEDVDGNRLLDFGSGIGVVNVGHRPEHVVRAVQEQANRFIHTSFNIVPYAGYVELCERLNAATPGRFAKKSFLCNSGAEAVENSIKIARAYTGREAVVCFDHGFHGRTYMAMTLTAKAKPYRSGFGPFCPEVYRAPFPYRYRWDERDLTESQVADLAFERFVEVVNNQIDAKRVAAVMLEPVLGEGGFVAAPKVFMQRLRQFCTDNGIVLIADEIQSGFGRTGTLFACEQLGVEPDLMTLAKGIGAGMPISAVTGRAEIMDAPIEGGIGGTYGGNPLACAAALAVMDQFEKTDLLSRARSLGEVLSARLEAWRDRFPVVGDVRGLGAMRGMELVKDRKSKEPNKEAVGKLMQYAQKNGVILLSCGTYGNVIRFLMPLSIPRDQLEEGLAVVEAGLGTL